MAIDHQPSGVMPLPRPRAMLSRKLQNPMMTAATTKTVS
jgi:hypothetical protein